MLLYINIGVKQSVNSSMQGHMCSSSSRQPDGRGESCPWVKS